MSNANPFLSVIIPAYNEAERLPKTLKSTLEYLQKQPYTWDLTVVNDGSDDNTDKIVKQASVLDSRVKLLSYRANRGKGYAVRYGITRAGGKYRLFMDADNSTGIEHIESFLPYLERDFDIIIGSRKIAGAHVSVRQKWWKEKLGDLGNLWIQFWTVPGIKDTQAGFKIYTAQAAMDIFPRLTVDRWGFDIETLAIARLKDYRIIERPIRWINAPESKVTPKAYLDVLKEVMQIKSNVKKGVYE